MKVKIFVNNPFQENTILLYDETKEAVVIDCGCFDSEEREAFKKFVRENQLQLVCSLNTHLQDVYKRQYSLLSGAFVGFVRDFNCRYGFCLSNHLFDGRKLRTGGQYHQNHVFKSDRDDV